MPASSSPIAVFPKDPTATALDYTIDWTDWLGDDTILSSNWVVPSGLVDAGSVKSSRTATIFLSGGAAGTSYGVINTITTAAGRIDKRTIAIDAIDR